MIVIETRKRIWNGAGAVVPVLARYRALAITASLMAATASRMDPSSQLLALLTVPAGVLMMTKYLFWSLTFVTINISATHAIPKTIKATPALDLPVRSTHPPTPLVMARSKRNASRHPAASRGTLVVVPRLADTMEAMGITSSPSTCSGQHCADVSCSRRAAGGS